MSDLREYSALTTKIKGMSRKFITDDQYREILLQPNINEALHKLKTTAGYGPALSEHPVDELHRSDVYDLLLRASYLDFASIYHFSNGEQRKFLKHYIRHFEIHLIKRCIQRVIAGDPLTLGMMINEDFFNRYSDLDLRSLVFAASITELIDRLAGTPYHALLTAVAKSPEPTLFDYENTLDQFYFSSMWKAGGGLHNKKGIKIIKEAFGTKFDLLNLLFIDRVRRYYKLTRAEIYGLLIPVTLHLSDEELRALISADSDESFNAVLAKTYYGRKKTFALTAEDLDKDYRHLMSDVVGRMARRMPYSIATPYRYLLLKEQELAKLMTALECVHYGMSVAEGMALIKEA
ncbi:MAG: V-type ATPase subunit [Lachnospiraceae bacterium]|nr:V-type ATPase subunit [Lachnospiraceae bacterium]